MKHAGIAADFVQHEMAQERRSGGRNATAFGELSHLIAGSSAPEE